MANGGDELELGTVAFILLIIGAIGYGIYYVLNNSSGDETPLSDVADSFSSIASSLSNATSAVSAPVQSAGNAINEVLSGGIFTDTYNYIAGAFEDISGDATPGSS
jgi:hypothetical protein